LRELWDRDRDPLASLAKGDPELFERFVVVEAATFTGFFRRLGAGPEEAEDLTQDLYLKLYSQADSYLPSERFTPFAFRIARNAWIDRARRRSTRGKTIQGSSVSDEEGATRDLFEETPGDQLDAAEQSSRREEANRLHAALGSLSEMHRAVFELGALQELSYAEVGELLGVPVGTVKSRMFYALRRLRELLEGDSNESAESESSTIEPRVRSTKS